MSYDKQIYEKAEAEINRRRFSAENEHQRRLDELSRVRPEIKEINNQLSGTVIELTKLIISKKGDFHNQFDIIKEKNLQAQQLIGDILESSGYPRDYLEMHYTCPVCSDKGYVDGQRCSCFVRLLNSLSIEKLNESANMPDCDFNHFSLEYYRGKKAPNGRDCFEVMSEIYDYCRAYAESFSENSDNIIMYGKTGIGKTHLSLSIAKAVAEKGYTVAYGSLINYLSIIEREHFGKAGENSGDTMNLLIDTELLILDDLGSEFTTNFNESITYNIINSRINLGRPTIINTNLSIEELQKKYNDRIISRIFGVYNMLFFVGDDIRQIKRLKS